ncbi:cutinase-domain-containing protein [Plectosphaerella plurivora]|uniref:cutinase n=1 Tax=Plectosphaerella plurivora TaxID=936078 RepID=A0A9P8V812_9PEZI|nr:cutinase-domain-containing protein [Plectosphaerella plurivora]
MRFNSLILPLAGTIAVAVAQTHPIDTSPLEGRSPVPDIGAILDDLPALISDIVSTSISIVTALKQAVKDDALVRNDLDRVLGPVPTPTPTISTIAPGATPLPPVTSGAPGTINGLVPRQAQPPVNGTAACPDVAILFARGTKEPGNVGFLAGPPLFAALETYVNGTSAIAVQGISYKSKGSSDRGPALMADFAQRTTAACPKTRIAMAGYSIGAVVVRSALEQMGTAGVSNVNSVVLFGDPREGQPVPAIDAGHVSTFCHEGDLVCRSSSDRQNSTTPGATPPPPDLANEEDDMTGTDGGRKNMLGAHLDYGIDAPAAAMFIMQRSGLGVASDDAMNQGMEGTLAGMVQDIARNGVDGIGA